MPMPENPARFQRGKELRWVPGMGWTNAFMLTKRERGLFWEALKRKRRLAAGHHLPRRLREPK